MKKVFIALVFVFTFLTHTSLRVSSAAENTGVGLLPFDITQPQTQAEIGKALKETRRDGLTVWWYGSSDPLSADFVYFRADKLVMTSTDRSYNQETLSQYIDKYGLPPSSYYKFKQGVEDIAQMSMHVWADDGVAVQTAGIDVGSPVLRDFRFSSTTHGDYLQLLAPDLVGNQPVQVTGLSLDQSFAATESTILEELNQFTKDNQIGVVIVLVLLVILLFVVVLFHRKKRTYWVKPRE